MVSMALYGCTIVSESYKSIRLTHTPARTRTSRRYDIEIQTSSEHRIGLNEFLRTREKVSLALTCLFVCLFVRQLGWVPWDSVRRASRV